VRRRTIAQQRVRFVENEKGAKIAGLFEGGGYRLSISAEI